MRRRLPPLLAVALLASGVSAQRVSPTVAAGVVLPRGSLAERFRPGPRLGGGIALGAPTSRWQGRLVAEYWFLPPGAPRPPVALPQAALHVTQVLLVASVGATAGRVRPRLSVGLGKAHPSQRGRPNPYGAVWAAAAGTSVSVPLGDRRILTVEAHLHALLSDYAVAEYTFATAVPLGLRLEF
jgi:hypothetical protein